MLILMAVLHRFTDRAAAGAVLARQRWRKAAHLPRVVLGSPHRGVPLCERLIGLALLLQGLLDVGAHCTMGWVPWRAFVRQDQCTQRRNPVTSALIARLPAVAPANAIIGLHGHNRAAFDNASR